MGSTVNGPRHDKERQDPMLKAPLSIDNVPGSIPIVADIISLGVEQYALGRKSIVLVEKEHAHFGFYQSETR